MGVGRGAGWISRSIPQGMRGLTNFLRPLPDFLIIGAGKAGTTSLYNYLVQHPQIVGAKEKEVHFFNRKFHRGANFYRSQYPLLRRRGPGFRRCDGTPAYLFHPHAPRRIKGLIPEARMVALLRDPVERAVSNYFHWVRMGDEKLPMREAFEAEEARLGDLLDRMLADPSVEDTEERFHFAYKRRGIYADSIARYWALFPREQLLVIKSEDFFERPEDILRQVCRFIGVDESFAWRDLSPHNVGGNKTEIPEDVRRMLREYYAPHNRRLEEMLGRKMGWE